MKIGIIIPTRGDRKKFLDHCLWQIKNQTRKPDEIILVNDPPKTRDKDITYRYRIGVERALIKGCDVMVFWEDDDWYSDDYLEWLLVEWEKNGKPTIFGIDETYYYNIGVHRYLYMKHPGRASAFCTLVTSKIKGFRWPSDDYSFVDLKLWKAYQGIAIPFDDKIRAIGIKHGIGMTGGAGHNFNSKWSAVDGLPWLKKNIDDFSFKFYDSLINEIRLKKNKIGNIKIIKRFK